MTAVTHLPTSRRALPRVGDAGVVLALAIGAAALTLFLNSGLIGQTMRGGFGDPDDAMRLVEVRNWLAGQSWFDMNAARIDPPHGSILHWSRLVDLPVASLISLFGRVSGPAAAERLAAVAVPTLWLVLLYLGMMRLGVLLVGPVGRLPALIGTFLSGATLVQFVPGRIGHHAPETVTLVLAIGCAVAAVDARHVRQAFACGVLIALALAMSLETLPFLVALAGAMIGLWVWDGVPVARALGGLAAGLITGPPAVFLATVGPDHWFAPACDAYSAAHLGAGLIGAVGALVLAAATPALTTRPRRLAAASVVGALALGYLRLAYPACLHSPFAGVDPLVRELWLHNVVESYALLVFMRTRPLVGVAIVAPVVFGCAASIVAAAQLSGVGARRFVLVAFLSVIGLGLAFWQVRTLGSTTPIALCGGIVAVSALRRRIGAWAPIAILGFASTVWLLVLPSDAPTRAETEATAARTACLSPEGLAPLALLPPGSAVAPIDSGSHLLEATSLSVFAAPYHRNDDGNRFAFEVFLAPPDAARALLSARNVTYVVTCPGMPEMRRLVARAPEGLAALLASGRVPPFLARQDLPAGPYEVYRVQDGR